MIKLNRLWESEAKALDDGQKENIRFSLTNSKYSKLSYQRFDIPKIEIKHPTRTEEFIPTVKPKVDEIINLDEYSDINEHELTKILEPLCLQDDHLKQLSQTPKASAYFLDQEPISPIDITYLREQDQNRLKKFEQVKKKCISQQRELEASKQLDLSSHIVELKEQQKQLKEISKEYFIKNPRKLLLEQAEKTRKETEEKERKQREEAERQRQKEEEQRAAVERERIVAEQLRQKELEEKQRAERAAAERLLLERQQKELLERAAAAEKARIEKETAEKKLAQEKADQEAAERLLKQKQLDEKLRLEKEEAEKILKQKQEAEAKLALEKAQQVKKELEEKKSKLTETLNENDKRGANQKTLSNYYDPNREQASRLRTQLDTTFSASPVLKAYKFDLQKAVTFPLNTILDSKEAKGDMNEYRRNVVEKIKILVRLLGGQTCSITSTLTVNTSKHPMAVQFCLVYLAQKLVEKGEQTVSSRPETAFQYCLAINEVLKLTQLREMFESALWSQFYEKCPFCVPYYRTKEPGQTENQFLESLGYKIESNGKIEDQVQYVKRMSGIMYLYFTFLVSSQVPSDFDGVKRAWRWLVDVLNMAPRPEMTAEMLAIFFKCCGHRMQQVYGNQFHKLVQTCSNDFVPLIRSIPAERQSGASLGRLENILDTYKKNRQQFPEWKP